MNTMRNPGLMMAACSLALTAGLAIAAAQADIIKIPLAQQASSLQGLTLPLRGQSTARVTAQFGEPLSKEPAVGDPPISSWEYADYVVYFEYDHVITSVLKHKPVVSNPAAAQPDLPQPAP